MGPEVPSALPPAQEPPAARVWAAMTRIVACGEIDMSTSGRLFSGVLEVLRRQRPSRIEVDLAGVTFLDASGVRALLMSQTAAAEAGCRLTLIKPSRMAYRVLEIVGLLETFGLAALPPPLPRPRRPHD
ncbi:STAS domain-containing protein [Microbispora sp. NEAU-D428]|uniref:STAS domain-containing protein n=1 Tax=Microbispora sitophila TaxID=2771537 RepID=UPI001865B5CD|nr:STAS domain-containing protein [Microbispora sitophila]MBE3008103.1 STAS domain-containing protein [Microbispora sitophila]